VDGVQWRLRCRDGQIALRRTPLQLLELAQFLAEKFMTTNAVMTETAITAKKRISSPERTKSKWATYANLSAAAFAMTAIIMMLKTLPTVFSIA
jgi:hypothetical protein